MSQGVIASSQSYTTFSTSTIQRRRCSFTQHNRISFPSPNSPCSLKSSRTNLRCKGFGDSGGKISDAFLLGKAVGEVLIERVESSVGEIRALFVKLQTDQLKYILQFEEEVLERVVRDKAAAALGSASSTVKEAAHGVEELITSATEHAAQGLNIPSAGSTAEHATQLVSEAASTVGDVSKTISSVASLLKPKHIL